MSNPLIKAAILAGVLILPAQAMAAPATPGSQPLSLTEGVVLASHDGHGRGDRYDRRDKRRDHRYDRRDDHRGHYYGGRGHKHDKRHKVRKHKKKQAKAYRKGYRHGLRDNRRHARKHYRSHNRHHTGYAYGYYPRRAKPHYHRSRWGWYPCSVFH